MTRLPVLPVFCSCERVKEVTAGPFVYCCCYLIVLTVAGPAGSFLIAVLLSLHCLLGFSLVGIVGTPLPHGVQACHELLL